jgi:hypothetical protein
MAGLVLRAKVLDQLMRLVCGTHVKALFRPAEVRSLAPSADASPVGATLVLVDQTIS